MTTQSPQKTSSKGSAKARALSARLRASQAVYQVLQNGESLRDTAAEYLAHRMEMVIDGEELVQPDRELLKTLLLGIYEVFDDLKPMVEQNLASSVDTEEEGDVSDNDASRKRRVDDLLMAIMMCAAYEIVIRQDVDAPIVINDYLNVTHAFYDRNEASLVNAVLDRLAKTAL